MGMRRSDPSHGGFGSRIRGVSVCLANRNDQATRGRTKALARSGGTERLVSDLRLPGLLLQQVQGVGCIVDEVDSFHTVEQQAKQRTCTWR